MSKEGPIEVRNCIDRKFSQHESDHRSVYLPLLRGLIPISLEVFDFAEQGMVTDSRDTTTVATQALYLLNDPFVRRQAQALAELALKSSEDNVQRVDTAYLRALGRAATPKDVGRATAFIAEYEASARQEGMGPDQARRTAWTSFCQALLASAEFRYLR